MAAESGHEGSPRTVARPHLCDASTQTTPSKTGRDAATQADGVSPEEWDEIEAKVNQEMHDDTEEFRQMRIARRNMSKSQRRREAKKFRAEKCPVQ